MNITVNIAGYLFVRLDDCQTLKQQFKTLGKDLNLKGTILLSPEGINFMLAGQQDDIASFRESLTFDKRFGNMPVKTSYSEGASFKRFLVKVKREIITMRTDDIDPEHRTGKRISAKMLKHWLDLDKPIVILDTRNDYEIACGKFTDAIDLELEHFDQFPERVDNMDSSLKDKTIVTYCTGGVRCEKASAYMMEKGFTDVYQLDGGILQYFAECGGDHYTGDCFVFDQREALNAELATTTID